MSLTKIEWVFVTTISAMLTVCFSASGSHEDTDRVSHTDFIKTNPEFSDVDFSAIGKLTLNGKAVCSAVLLEPGNVVATAQHCVDMDAPNTAYAFVTRDKSGKEHTIPLPAHGTRYFQYLHIPTPRYFDPSIDIHDTKKFNHLHTDEHEMLDIAFFQLTTPTPEEIKPARIAPRQDIERVIYTFAAGYSPHVRAQKDGEDSGLSISKRPCSQALFEGYPDLVTTFCDVRQGDSGGGSFVIKDGHLNLTGIYHQRKISGKPFGFAVEINQMRDFCLESMGPDYCSGFPDPQNANTLTFEQS